MFSKIHSEEIDALLEEIALKTFGRSLKDPGCVCCGTQKVSRSDFKDQESYDDFLLTRMCQDCQDGVYESNAQTGLDE